MQFERKYDPQTTFFVLDFDRTLGNTDKFHEILEMVIAKETNLTAEFLSHARHKAESAGESFDTIGYLRRYLEETASDISWPDIQRVFVAQALQENTLEPGAAELLSILDEQNIPYGIITYGNEAWQLLKLEGANLLDVPHLVTHIQQKGRILTEWKQNNGTFLIPAPLTKDFTSRSVNTIIFLDDKAVSFKDIPQGVTGVRIRPPEGIKLLAQKGDLPPDVYEVEGIKGAIELLFN